MAKKLPVSVPVMKMFKVHVFLSPLLMSLVVSQVTEYDYNTPYDDYLADILCDSNETGPLNECIAEVLLPFDGLEFGDYLDAVCEFFDGTSTELGECFSVCVDNFFDLDCTELQTTFFDEAFVQSCGQSPISACENFFGISDVEVPYED